MKALLLRRREAAESDAARLASAGVETVISPLISIAPVATDVPSEIGTLAFTSASGVAGFAALTSRRDPPVQAVGPATAEAARRAGFREVLVGPGDGASLAEQIIATDVATPVVHFRGRDSAFDLNGALNGAGIMALERIVYRAEAAAELTPAAITALRTGDIGVIAFHSPRISRIFAGLVASMGVDLSQVVALAISDNAAVRLSECGFRQIRTAPSPTGDAMIAEIKDFAYKGRG